ncbi:hypothetical protein ACFL17_09660 [Pseudomonadota bacterium]
MSLEDSLAKLREMSKKRYGEDIRSVMMNWITDQRDVGIVEAAIKPGDALPAFALPDHNNNTVNSADLLAEGAVVLTVFRGHW